MAANIIQAHSLIVRVFINAAYSDSNAFVIETECATPTLSTFSETHSFTVPSGAAGSEGGSDWFTVLNLASYVTSPSSYAICPLTYTMTFNGVTHDHLR